MTRKNLENKIINIRQAYINHLLATDFGVRTSKTNNNLQFYKSDKFNLIIETSYSHLSKLDQLIINNEFFYGDYPGWWRKYFSSPLFFKLRKEAMKRFLEGIAYES